MIYISHRGNLTGPNNKFENSPEYIQAALDAGYSVEIDLRMDNGTLYLGHDFGQYLVEYEWLKVRQTHLWIHCKDREAFEFCLGKQLHCFWHEDDDYTMTRNGYVWAYPGNEKAGKFTILVLPEYHHSIDEISKLPCFGICSDYVDSIKNT